MTLKLPCKIVWFRINDKLKRNNCLYLIIDETVNTTADKSSLWDWTRTAQCLFNEVVDSLNERGVVNQLSDRSDRADEASVITGTHSGLGTVLKKESPFSIQVHSVANHVAQQMHLKLHKQFQTPSAHWIEFVSICFTKTQQESKIDFVGSLPPEATRTWWVWSSTCRVLALS